MKRVHCFIKTICFQTVPTYSLDKTNITSGDCRKTRILNLKYPEDGATIQFTFKNNSGTVNMQLTFSFLPSNIWTGGSNSKYCSVPSSIIYHARYLYPDIRIMLRGI